MRFQREGQGRWRLDPLEDKHNGTSEGTSDGWNSLGLPSLRGFGLLAFALLVFLFQAVDVCSQQIGVSHLKLDNLFGADHGAYLSLAIRRPQQTFVVGGLK